MLNTSHLSDEELSSAGCSTVFMGVDHERLPGFIGPVPPPTLDKSESMQFVPVPSNDYLGRYHPAIVGVNVLCSGKRTVCLITQLRDVSCGVAALAANSVSTRFRIAWHQR
jgi:hypothetical protein